MWLNSLKFLISKNMKIIFRSKISTIFILLLPLIAIILMGHTLSSSGVDRINIGVVYSPENVLEMNILNGINDEGFKITDFSDLDECVQDIKLSKTHLCIFFPTNFSLEGSRERVNLYVDSSRKNIAYLVLNEIESQFSKSSSDLGVTLISDLSNSLQEASSLLVIQRESLEEALTELDNLDKNIDLISSSQDLSNSISKLNSIKGDLSGDYSEDIESIISKLNDINDYYSTNKIEKLRSSQNEIKSKLEDSIQKLGELIEKINKLSLLDADNIVSPINTQVEFINSDNGNFNFAIPTAIALVSLFGGILISAGLTLRERKTKAYFRNFMTPATNFTFLLADYITCMLILFFQFSLVFLALHFLFDIILVSLWLELLVILFLAFSSFTLIGMFIGYIFKSEETITFASVTIATIFVIFSNILLPVESFLSSFSKLIVFNPLFIVDSAFRKIIIFNYDMAYLLNEIYILIGMFFLFFFLSWLGRIFTKRIL